MNTSADKAARLWSRVIPWFATGFSVAILGALAWFLLENLAWFRAGAAIDTVADARYRIYIFQMHLAMVKRSVGLFAGFALIFVGTSIAFYTLQRGIVVGGEAKGIAAKLATTSPGIVAMFLGTLLMMFTIYSKDTFPEPPPIMIAAPNEDAPLQQPF